MRTSLGGSGIVLRHVTTRTAKGQAKARQRSLILATDVLSSVPKGLRPPAQRCRNGATLGFRRQRVTTWNGLRPPGHNAVGVEDLMERLLPKVAAARQPWAFEPKLR